MKGLAMLLIALLVLSVISYATFSVLTAPLVKRQLEVQAANRQYMIDNNTTIRPFS